VLDNDAAAMTAREALEIATLGGARVLGREDIGAIVPGASADFIAVNLDRPALAGAQHDPIAALVLCQVDHVDFNFINGRKVVDHGQLVTADLPRLVARANRLSAAMLRG
jgi:cytosine/adenosine deaminase-related metal-dependent hydrolase